MRKIRVTTLLSLTGVLVAGSAAALVNTQVLGNPTPRPETMSEITAVLTLPPTTIAASVSDTTLPSPVPPTSETISLAPSASSVFDVEGVGTVTLDSSGDVLRLVSADTSPGWTVTATNQVDPSQVKVTLQSLDRTIEFSADLAGGEVTTSVEQSSNVLPSDNSTPVSTSNSSFVPTPSSTPAGGSGPSRTDGSEGRPSTTLANTGTTTQSTTPSNAPTTSDDHGGGKGSGGGGKGGDDIDD